MNTKMNYNKNIDTNYKIINQIQNKKKYKVN